MSSRLLYAITATIVALPLCWAAAWAAARALVVQVSIPRADAVLVLAGAPVYGERVMHGGRLLLDGRADRLLLTNDGNRGSWSRTLQRNPLLVERAMLHLVWGGVPSSKIEILPGTIASTYEEALVVRRYVESHHVRSLIVVTSSYHTRRAQWILGRVLADAGVTVGIEAANPEPSTPPAATWWRYSRGWQMVAAEYVKLAYYFFRYSSTLPGADR